MRNLKISVLLFISLSIFDCNASENKLDYMKGCSNIDATNKCTACAKGYVLSQTNTCVFSLNYCTQNSPAACTISGCLKQVSDQCQECVAYQQLDNGACKWWSYKTNSLTTDLDSQNLCTPSGVDELTNCSFCYFNKNECDKCNSGTLFYNGQCLTACPAGSFKVNTFKCQQCHPRCKTCTTYDQCDTCANSNTAIANDCACQTGFAFQNSCAKSCPYTHIEEKVCTNKCFSTYSLQGEAFPIFYKESFIVSDLMAPFKYENPSFYCDAVQNANSQYCDQNLNHLSELIMTSISDDSSVSPPVHVLKIVINETPHFCYTYKLVGLDSYEVANTFLDTEYTKATTNQRQTFLVYRILHADLKDVTKVDAQDDIFSLQLKIFQGSDIRIVFNIFIKLDVTGKLSTQRVGVQGQPEKLDCSSCSVYSSILIDATFELICDPGQTCNSDTITAKVNSEIKFSQTLTNPTYQDLTIIPTSIVFEYGKVADNTNQTVYFTNYHYDNSVKGKIIYSLSGVGIGSGKLTVSAYATSTPNRMLDQSQEFEVFEKSIPFQSFNLEITRPLSEQIKEWMFYGMIIVIIFFIFRKQDPTTIKQENSIQNFKQIPKAEKIQIRTDE